MTEPEPLAVINQEFDRRVRAATEHKHRAPEGVFLQDHSTPLRQPVDASPEVHRFHGHQYTRVRGDGDHGVPQKAAHSGASWVSPGPCKLTRIVPPCAF
jgi:hypothetical protein